MRWNEIISEAKTPKDQVTIYVSSESQRSLVEIGGRVLGDGNWDIKHTLRNINLKNVRSQHGPLLFHGSISQIGHFHDHSWFSAEPQTAITHAEFWRSLSMGSECWLYVCNAKFSNAYYDKPFTPGDEAAGQLAAFYEEHPNIDAIVWKDTKDVVMPTTDLYNIRSGDQITILKKWSIVSEEVTDADLDTLANGGDLAKPEARKVDKAEWVVVDPGLCPVEAGDQLTQGEYEEYSEYGLTAKRL